MEQLHVLRQRTANATKQLFRGPPDTDEPKYLPEDGMNASNTFSTGPCFILLGFSALEIVA
ncbi:hypothetical protein BGZ92_001992 [Podila epicladia]|nr:hypothetical protein BGZ92_001992 [Podila epicladia]